MDFTTVYDSFTQSLDGTDSYVALRQHLDSLMASDPDNAVSYYILRGLADSYVTLYADQAVSPEFAHQVKVDMTQLLEGVKATLSDRNAPFEQRYQAINQLVLRYLASKKRF